MIRMKLSDPAVTLNQSWMVSLTLCETEQTGHEGTQSHSHEVSREERGMELRHEGHEEHVRRRVHQSKTEMGKGEGLLEEYRISFIWTFHKLIQSN